MNSLCTWCQARRVPLFPSIFIVLNDTEDQFIHSDFERLDLDMFKLFMLLYADDIVIFANNAEE